MTLLNRVRPVNVTGFENPNVPLSSQTLLDFMGIEATKSGKLVTEVSALGLPAVWRAMMLSASVPAALPFDAYLPSGSGPGMIKQAPGTQAAQFMAKPHEDMTKFEFWRLVGMHRKGWGNAYGLIMRNNAQRTPSSLRPLHPARVKVGRTSEYKKIFEIDGGPDAGGHVLDETDILHFPGIGYDDICGVSPIRVARESIGLGLAAEEFGARFFGSGSLASGILQTEQRLTQTQADNLAKRWKEKRTGLMTAHEAIVLDKGATFEQLTIPPNDAQFLETRRFQVTEICRWFGIPPFLMFETETSTSWGTGLEQQALAWVKFDLTTDLVSVEQRMSRLLYPQPTEARYSADGLLRGDAAARAAFYTAMWGISALSSNEIRGMENLAPREGGDVYGPAKGPGTTPGTEPSFTDLEKGEA